MRSRIVKAGIFICRKLVTKQIWGILSFAGLHLLSVDMQNVGKLVPSIQHTLGIPDSRIPFRTFKTVLLFEMNTERPNPLSNYFNDETFSDLTVTCKDKVFKVHRIVLCSQSTFFDTACRGLFRVCLDA